MRIKKVLKCVLKSFFLFVAFASLLLFSFSLNYAMAQQSEIYAIQNNEMQSIRQSELQKKNYDIENWVIYNEDEKYLYLCKGDMYGFGVKFLLFKITNGFLFGKKINK